MILLLVLVAIIAACWGLAVSWRRTASRELRVILTGGGTGGHVNPALAIGEGIRTSNPDARFLYVGVRGKAEAVIVRRAGHALKFVSSQGFPGLRPSVRLVRFLLKLGVGVVQSMWIAARFRPRWVVATGGYVSAPMIVAVLVLRALHIAPTKIYVHEQNSIPGQLNALLGRWVDRVLLTFPQTISLFPGNGVVVGYPIRGAIAPKWREEALANLSFKVPEGRKVVFAFGGSQGARTINRALVDALPHLTARRNDLFIIHGMGLNKSADYDAAKDTEARLQSLFGSQIEEEVGDFYYRQDYFHNIADVYSVSDLIVCRSGAGSLNEISRLGVPALLIPKANLPGDHQVMNARAMKSAGAAEILYEDTIVEGGEVLEKLEGKVLADRILSLLDDEDRRARMAERCGHFLRKDAVDRILSELHQDRKIDNGSGGEVVPFKPLIGNATLLNALNRARSGAPAVYEPVNVVGDPDDLSYYRHRAAGLLSHESWQDRNLGVKLVGLTRYSEMVPTLLHMLMDRTPVSRFKRMLGGDFRQVGFIRRNIVEALQIIDEMRPEIERALLSAMNDPYYEVRTKVCVAAAWFGTRLVDGETWYRVLVDRLRDPCFEVVIEAAKALGKIGTDERCAEVLLGLGESHYWQVRDAALRGMRCLIERGVVTPSPMLIDRTKRFILTATDFRPHFSIKETYKSLESLCNKGIAERLAHEPELLPPSPPARKG